VFIVLIAGVVVSTSLYVQADRARAEATAQRDRAIAAEEDTAAVNAFFKDLLGAVDPFQETARPGDLGVSDVSVFDMLQNAVPKIEQRFADRPELEIEARWALASAFFSLGHIQSAEEQYRTALGICRRTWGDDHELTVRSMLNLAWALGFQGKQEAVDLTRLGFEGARELFGSDHSRTMSAAHGLAYFLRSMGRYGEAEALLLEVLPVLEQRPEDQQEERCWSLAVLASVQCAQGKFDQAERNALRSRRLAAQIKGPDSVIASFPNFALAESLQEQERFVEAVQAMRALVQGYENQFGKDHRMTLHGESWLAHAMFEAGELAQAESLMREVLEKQRRGGGRADSDECVTLRLFAQLLNARGAFQEAEKLSREFLRASPPRSGYETPGALNAKDALARALYGQGRLAEAEALWLEIVQTAERVFTTGYYEVPAFRRHYGQCLTDMARYAEAEKQLLMAYDSELAIRGEAHRKTRAVVGNLVHLYESWGKPDKVAEWRARLAAIQPATEQTGQNP
jgi:tetratricopeptide (TPR) repeat protein